MLICRIDKYRYKTNLCLGMILSIILVIVLLLFSPKQINKNNEIPFYREPVISLIDIPVSFQPISHSSSPAIPDIPNILQAEIEIDLLKDVEIKLDKIKDGMDGHQILPRNETQATKTFHSSSFPFVPRQIIEAVPEEVDGAVGFINVNILIGVEGMAKEINIIENTTNNRHCLIAVEKAIYKSKWQQIKFEGLPVEYWIEKTYGFN